MRIAIWRQGAQLITGLDSTAGGGIICEEILKALVKTGHECEVIGKTKDATRNWLDMYKVPVVETFTPSRYDAVFLLSGPNNPMYDALYDTYDRIASFEGRVLFACYDLVLGFEFDPGKKWSLFRSKSNVTAEDIQRNKTWEVVGQAPFDGVEFHHCVFDAAVVNRGKPLPCPDRSEVSESLVYIGSPRPARYREFKRWFCQDGLRPVLHGKWKGKTDGLDVLAEGQRVLETRYRQTVRSHLATIHLTDKAYVLADYIPQRLIDNAMSGTSVIYSDFIPPSIARVVNPAHIVSSVDDAKAFLERVRVDESFRIASVMDNQSRIVEWAKIHPLHPTNVLSRIL